MGNISISVVVPAYNAAVYVGECITALKAAGFEAREIFLVDDASTDGTGEIAAGQGVRVIRHETNRGAAAARNTGAIATEAEVLFFVDTDVTVHPDVKEILLRFFAGNPDYAAVFGAYDSDPASPEPISRARNLLHRFVHMESAGDIDSFWTGCGAVRHAAFDDVGRFRTEQRVMEDVDLGLRLVVRGHRIRLLPELQGRHHKRWTIAEIWRADFFDRAVPWARLLRGEDPALTLQSLNIGNRSRASVLAVAAGLCALFATPVFPLTGLAIALAAAAAVAILNAAFLTYVGRIDGAKAVPAALIVLIVHYFCGGLGFAWVLFGLDRLFPALVR